MKPKQAVLLDLGNVVLGIDFRRVFSAWASSANVDETVFYERWALDQAYKDHEIGALDFAAYTRALSARFDVEMSVPAWRDGWNDLWTEPFHDVVALLPLVAERYHLCGFTNTNQTHANRWRAAFPDELSSFAKIYVSSEIGLRKPDTESFSYVCADMGATAANTTFLDDTLENVEGAQRAGLEAVHVPRQADVVTVLSQLLKSS